EPGTARPATPTGPRRSSTPSRRAAEGWRPRAAGASSATPAQLVHQLVERRAEALEAAGDVERLEQVLAERGVRHDGRGDPVRDHAGGLSHRQGRVEKVGRTLERLEQAAARGSDPGQRRRDVRRRRHVLELLRGDDPVEGVARALALDPDAPLALYQDVVAA